MEDEIVPGGQIKEANLNDCLIRNVNELNVLAVCGAKKKKSEHRVSDGFNCKNNWCWWEGAD
jgi:hypothetical protein